MKKIDFDDDTFRHLYTPYGEHNPNGNGLKNIYDFDVYKKRKKKSFFGKRKEPAGGLPCGSIFDKNVDEQENKSKYSPFGEGEPDKIRLEKAGPNKLKYDKPGFDSPEFDKCNLDKPDDNRFFIERDNIPSKKKSKSRKFGLLRVATYCSCFLAVFALCTLGVVLTRQNGMSAIADGVPVAQGIVADDSESVKGENSEIGDSGKESKDKENKDRENKDSGSDKISNSQSAKKIDKEADVNKKAGKNVDKKNATNNMPENKSSKQRVENHTNNNFGAGKYGNAFPRYDNSNLNRQKGGSSAVRNNNPQSGKNPGSIDNSKNSNKTGGSDVILIW